MAYGGYKFKGYSVVRANLTDNTYSNWCLLVHQARIKAFIESCSLSGAQWHFSKTNGHLPFEDYGNVIYKVRNDNYEYNNFLSFFKYGDENLYYMLATLGEYYPPSSSSVPHFRTDSRYCGTGSTTATSRKFKFMSCASSLSYSEFADTGPFAFTGGYWPTDALSCSSQRCDSEDTDTNWGSVNEGSLHGSFLAYTSIRIGCATKGKDIIWLNTSNNKVCIESGDGFQSYSDPDDHFGLLKIVLGTNTSENSAVNTSSSLMLNFNNIEVLTSKGIQAFGYNLSTSVYSNMELLPPYETLSEAGGQKVSFVAPYVWTWGRNWQNISDNFFQSKGVVKGELLSMNLYPYGSFDNTPTLGTCVLGCNLIETYKSSSISTNTLTIHNNARRLLYPGRSFINGIDSSFLIAACCYTGWDPSNPDISQSSAWPELSLYVSE